MKRFVCIDLEMSELTKKQRTLCKGLRNEVIQIGAVMLDENYNYISQFSSFVKPSFSNITPTIENLTGINQSMIENADDFITVLDKYNYWIGDNDIITYCWSSTDYKQLWNELHIKAKHRTDLQANLKTFVDLQKTFSNLIHAQKTISLQSAIEFSNSKFIGTVHTALADAYNTACILHKICKNKLLKPQFEFLYNTENPENDLIVKDKNAQKDYYTNSFASFMSNELLEKYGLDKPKDTTPITDDYSKVNIPKKENLFSKQIQKIFSKQKKVKLCNKYGISIFNWISFNFKISLSDEMKIIV